MRRRWKRNYEKVFPHADDGFFFSFFSKGKTVATNKKVGGESSWLEIRSKWCWWLVIRNESARRWKSEEKRRGSGEWEN